jgi:hypothetical protein
MLITAKIGKIMTSENYKTNEDTYQALLDMYEFFCDGRIFLARELLENILGIETKEKA